MVPHPVGAFIAITVVLERHLGRRQAGQFLPQGSHLGLRGGPHRIDPQHIGFHRGDRATSNLRCSSGEARPVSFFRLRNSSSRRSRSACSFAAWSGEELVRPCRAAHAHVLVPKNIDETGRHGLGQLRRSRIICQLDDVRPRTACTLKLRKAGHDGPVPVGQFRRGRDLPRHIPGDGRRVLDGRARLATHLPAPSAAADAGPPSSMACQDGVRSEVVHHFLRQRPALQNLDDRIDLVLARHGDG